MKKKRGVKAPKYLRSKPKSKVSSLILDVEALDCQVVQNSDEDVTIISEDDTTLLIKGEYENIPKTEFLELYKINQLQLSYLEQRFVEFYCETYVGTESAIQAGYTNNRASASVQASRLLKKDKINEAINMRPMYLRYTKNIPDKQGIRERLTLIIDDMTNTPFERMKAIDMLAKLDFHYEKEQEKADNNFVVTIQTSEEVKRIQQEQDILSLESSVTD